MGDSLAILLVEDDEAEARLVRYALADGDNITHETTLETARSLISNQRFDAVLLDLSLPDSYGIETVARMVCIAPTTPIVVLTGNDDDRLATLALSIGAQDYLHKDDIDRDKLSRSLRYAVERKRAEEALRQAHDALEHRVQERTAELEEANRLLQAEIDERKRAEAELRQAKKDAEAANTAKSDFLATMSHELRTPLNGVIGMTELLLRTELSAQQKRFAWLVKASGDTLVTLINDVLDFSKIEAGKLELETIDFDLRYIVENVVLSLASRAEGKGLELMSNVQNNVPHQLRGDPGRLQQVLINLVSNAIKFTERGDVLVQVGLESSDEHTATLRFSVIDTGIGIPSDRIGRLFQAFTQLDSSTARKYGGTGLGLAICRRLVECMGGQISVESEHGCGSNFRFSLQFALQTASSATLGPSLDELRRVKVLAVDDNFTNREIVQEFLLSNGIHCDIASNAKDALAMLRDAVDRNHPYGLALLDAHMPEMDGQQLAAAIKADARIAATILVLLSSVDPTESSDRVFEMGFSGFLCKPLRHSQLMMGLADALSHRRKGETGNSATRATRRKSEHGGADVNRAGAKILVAEDNEISQEVVGQFLKHAGFEYEIVDTGQKAIDAFRAGGFDLILMDCQMLPMDGFEAAKAIRSLEQGDQRGQNSIQRIPIVAVTANAVSGDRERCIEAGMDDYLSKPLSVNKLMATIEAGLASRCANVADESTNPNNKSTTEAISSVAQGDNDVGANQISSFDVSSLMNTWNGNRSLILRLFERFESRAAEDIRNLDECCQHRDFARSAQIAHSLKGAAAYMAAEKLRQLAIGMESTAINKQLGQFDVSLRELRDELHRCLVQVPLAKKAVKVQNGATA